jgi:UDP-3-O-[3-hydroxymyristoyl] glucosamine N-acyltransferase
MKLSEIATALGCSVLGNADLEISGVAGLEDAGPRELTFLSNPKYTPLVRQTKAAAILANAELADCDLAVLVSVNPYLDFARAIELFHPAPHREPGIHPTAVISESARVGENASIGPFVVIESGAVIGNNAALHPHVVIERDVTIGDDFEAHPQVTVRHGTKIGNRVILHNGVTVGSDGFGFARRPDGSHHKIPQAGIVIIEDDVEIQAGSCIDRAAVGETRIGRGTKIDNLVQIGHAVKVGSNTILCAQVGIAGSTTVGDNCVLAGQVGLVNHLKIGDGVLITAQSGVSTDLPDGAKVSGYPATDNRQWLRSTVVYNKLPELAHEVRKIRKKLASDD